MIYIDKNALKIHEQYRLLFFYYDIRIMMQTTL